MNYVLVTITLRPPPLEHAIDWPDWLHPTHAMHGTVTHPPVA